MTSTSATTSSTSPPFSSSPAASKPAHLGRRVELVGGAEVLITSRSDGDARPGSSAADGDGDGGASQHWTFPKQVHGANVLVLEDRQGPLDVEADGLVSAAPEAVLAVLGADCPLIGFGTANGLVAVAHAGWRGLMAGVLEATVWTLRAEGGEDVVAALGPCIHAECYEFSPADLDRVAAIFGEAVRGETKAGAPALDLPAAVAEALARLEVPIVANLGGCTACSSEWFSFRARGDEGRHALAISCSPIR